MPYYFECDNCHEEVEIYGASDMRKDRPCDECGQDCCESCIEQDTDKNPLCRDCFYEWEAKVQKALDNEDDGA